MSDSGNGPVDPTTGHQSALTHMLATVEHLWSAVSQVAHITPLGQSGALASILTQAKGRLDSARTALGQAGDALAAAQQGDTAGVVSDLEAAAGSAVQAVTGEANPPASPGPDTVNPA